MTIERLNPNGVFVSGSPLSHGVVAGGFLFISGQVPRRPDGSWEVRSFSDQVACVFDNLRAVLRTRDLSFSDLCKVTVFLTDASRFDEFNALYRAQFPEEQPPARTTVCVALARPDIEVEVEAIAWAG